MLLIPNLVVRHYQIEATYVGCVWAIFYAVCVRFYEAAGGIIDNSHTFKDLESVQNASYASYFAGVIILVCGFILLGLVQPWGKVVPAWMPFMGGG
ncbi:hypothetical protein [Paenibacillus sedimenti]|uniref:Uncharacterized protein n=1 Tax=Paenibacillus sedimenti TaxID=2770274 RepID=A0A926KRM7_9BACL|nr:hypothetical protein [Paenibacillus sedimenti]MBD0382819.1 hypothetical protein [Paenibacillus sedimenti]